MATATKTQKKKKTACLLEEKTFGSSPSRVDREAGIIYGVKILGAKSGNAVPDSITGGRRAVGYTYNKTARAQLAELCEGMAVNIDHPDRKEPTKSRSMRDRFGKLQNVTVKGDSVYGDLHYLKSHVMAEQIAEAAERMPDVFGLSPVAHTEIEYSGNGYVVTGVSKVRSVDVVGKPATNSTLFEDEAETEDDVKVTFGEIFAKKPKIMAVIEEMGMADMPMDGAGAVAEVDPDEAIKAAFRTAVVAAFDDDSLDINATAKRIKDILKAYGKLTEEPATSETPTPPSGESESSPADDAEDAAEEKPPTTEELKEEMKVRDMLWKQGIEPTNAKVRALLVLEDEDEREELIESFKGGKTTPRKTPRSGFVMEGDETENAADQTSGRRSGKDFAKAVTNRTGGYQIQ